MKVFISYALWIVQTCVIYLWLGVAPAIGYSVVVFLLEVVYLLMCKYWLPSMRFLSASNYITPIRDYPTFYKNLIIRMLCYLCGLMLAEIIMMRLYL